VIARSLRNVLFVIGAVLFLGSLIANYVVINGFLTHPTNAIAASGETIPFEVKGKTVYITQGQKDQTTAIFVGEIAGLSILLTYGVLVFYRRK
jgi:hypothetical protein